MLKYLMMYQKTAYEILTCDWSSDVCSSDLWEKYVILQCCNGKRKTAYGYKWEYVK